MSDMWWDHYSDWDKREKIMETKPHPGDDFWYGVQYNPYDVPRIDDIVDFVAEVPGMNDEYDWWWILKLNDGYMLVHGGCDYTGWDCRSWMGMDIISDDIDEVINFAPIEENYSHRAIRKSLRLQVEGKTPFGLYDSKLESNKNESTE